MSGIIGRKGSNSGLISDNVGIGDLWHMTATTIGSSTLTGDKWQLATGTGKAHGPPVNKSLGMTIGTSGNDDGVFVFPRTGTYHVLAVINIYQTGNVHSRYNHLNFSVGSDTSSGTQIGQFSQFTGNDANTHSVITGQAFLYIDDTTAKRFWMSTNFEETTSVRTWLESNQNHGSVFFMKCGDI